MKRIYGYVKSFKTGCIQVHTEEPDYSDLPTYDYDWTYSVYGNVKEEIPKDAPKPRGKPVILTTFWDTNLYHDMVTGRAVTGIL